MSSSLRCGRCGTGIPPNYFNLDHLTPCPNCSTDLQTIVFPSLYRSTAQSGAEAAEASEATCFYHPENRAVVPCASCGRFLCAVCEIPLGGQTLCPGCVHTGVTSRRLVQLENRRMLYDNVALALAVAPTLLIWPTLFTAPMAVFLSVRYWRAPTTILRRTKIRFVLAAAFALCQIAVWGFGAYALALTRGWVR